MISKSRISLIAMLLAEVVAVSNSGCGGGSAAPPPISVTISPSSPTVDENSSVTFTTTVLNDPGHQGVTWKLSNSLLTGGKFTCGNSSACGTLSNQTSTSVTYTAPSSIPNATPPVQVIATSVADSNKSASASPIIIPAPVPTLTVNTSSLPNGTVNASYSVTLQSSGGTPPITWSFSPAAGLPPGLSPSGSGTISGTPATPGFSCFESYATDSSTPAQIAAQGLCIGINSSDMSHNALLKGHYAFLIDWFGHSGLKTPTQIAMVGSFVADGAGDVTGVSDTGFVANQPFTGTYALGVDNRGTLSIETSGTYAFSVGSMSASGVATKGRMIRFVAGVASAAGEFELQDPSAFSTSAVSGSYVFELSGRGAFSGQLGADGVFTADGNGSINTGNADENFNGTVTANQPLTGTYNIAANSTDGRGTGTLTIPGNFAFYVVSASKMLMVGADPTSNPRVFIGQALKQSGGPFNSSSLSGTSVFGTGTAGDVTAGLETFDGRVTVNVLQDQKNANGTVTLDSTTSDTYSVSSNGRVTVTVAGVPVSVLYLVSAGTGFILNADGSTGFLEPQSVGPFTESSIDGDFFFGNVPMPALSPASSGVATLKAGAINLTSDLNEGGTLIFGQSSQDSYVVSANGRVTTGSGNEVIYVISPTKFQMIDVNPTNTTLGITVAEQ